MSKHFPILKDALPLVVVALASSTSILPAQFPGAPVLQNAFAMPGLAVAANFGGGGGQSFYGLAGALGMGAGRMQLSAVAGAQRGNGATRGAYGGRVAASLWSSSGGALGVGAFAGFGGAPRTRTGTTVTNAAVLAVPVGLSLSYRRALGSSRGLSGYVSPMYRWTRANAGTTSTSNGAMRFAAALDFGFSPAFGATIGGEFGQNSNTSGPSTIGAALTIVPGRR